MAKFDKWCTTTKEIVNGHEMTVLNAEPAKANNAVEGLSKLLPSHYASKTRVAHLMKTLGKAATANYIEAKMPSTKSIRSGDLGEILGVSYLGEFTSFKYSVHRLQWKDHRNMAMRGEDLLAFKVDEETGNVLFIKGEVKSRVSLSSSTVATARKALSANQGRPSAHAVSFLADRYFEQGLTEMSDLLDTAQLTKQISSRQLTHMIFTFSGNDPAAYLRNDLQAYKGRIEQISVGLRVVEHQKFIKSVFDMVSSNGV